MEGQQDCGDRRLVSTEGENSGRGGRKVHGGQIMEILAGFRKTFGLHLKYIRSHWRVLGNKGRQWDFLIERILWLLCSKWTGRKQVRARRMVSRRKLDTGT